MKFNKILDILYPRRCPVCGDITGGFGRMICPDCLRKLSFVKSPVCKNAEKKLKMRAWSSVRTACAIRVPLSTGSPC